MNTFIDKLKLKGYERMQLLNKTFKCQTSLSFEECKDRILHKFSKRGIIASSGILLTSLHEEDDSVSFRLMQSKIRGFYVILDARILTQNAKVQIVGKAYVSYFTIFLLIYLNVITFVLALVFSITVWLSLFLLFGFGMILFFTITTFRNRDKLIKLICNLLST